MGESLSNAPGFGRAIVGNLRRLEAHETSIVVTMCALGVRSRGPKGRLRVLTIVDPELGCDRSSAKITAISFTSLLCLRNASHWERGMKDGESEICRRGAEDGARGGQWRRCVYPCYFLFVWMRLHHTFTSTLALLIPFLVLACDSRLLIRSVGPANAIAAAQPHLLIRCCHSLPSNANQSARERHF
jgi:hypothetical protein